MKKLFLILYFVAFSLAAPLPAQTQGASLRGHVLTAPGESLYLNGREFLSDEYHPRGPLPRTIGPARP